MPPVRPLADFPGEVAGFRQIGEDQLFSDEIMQVLGVDHYIMREYRDKDGYRLWLYIGYYESQTKGDIIHSPKHCMPGSGWSPLSQSVESLNLSGDSRPVSIAQMFMQKGLEKQLVHYWYHGRGRVIANEYLDRGLMILDSLLRRRSDGALVRITGTGGDFVVAAEKQQHFAAELLRIIPQYLPD